MKKLFKNTLAVILAALMLLPIISMTERANAANGMSIPTIYVLGRTEWIYRDIGTENEKVLWNGNVPVPDGYIAEKTQEILPLLTEALTTGNYDAYCDALVDAVSAIYADFKLGNNGLPTDGSTIKNKWNAATLRDTRHGNGIYYLSDYTYIYDWRLDPCETAKDLAKYIDAVLAVTGCSQVNLIGRCMGGTIEMSYLAQFGTEKVRTVTFLASTMNGCALASDSFAGQLNINADAVDRFVNERLGMEHDGLATDLITDELTMNLIKSTVSMLNTTQTLPIAAAAIEKLYDKIGTDVLPEILLNSYGSLPSFWSMVNQEDYEQAKELVFDGREEEYAEFIEKIDNYHYNVQAKIPELLKKFNDEDGVPVTILAKYGFQLTPLVESADKLNDDMIELDSASLGATCSTITGTLSKKYLESAERLGNGKYISPDKQVDASTCLFPDRTWFIKNNVHGDFSGDIEAFIWTELQAGGSMTVNSNPHYPQFMTYIEETDTLAPMTEENSQTRDYSFMGFFTSIVRFFRNLFDAISRYFDSLRPAEEAAA